MQVDQVDEHHQGLVENGILAGTANRAVAMAAVAFLLGGRLVVFGDGVRAEGVERLAGLARRQLAEPAVKLLVLVLGAAVFVLLTILGVRKAEKIFEKVDL